MDKLGFFGALILAFGSGLFLGLGWRPRYNPNQPTPPPDKPNHPQ